MKNKELKNGQSISEKERNLKKLNEDLYWEDSASAFSEFIYEIKKSK